MAISRQRSVGGRLAIGCAALVVACGSAATAELFGQRSLELQDGFGGAMQGFAFDSDGLGSRLAVGDFNCDGRDDLAITDDESISAEREGAVHVLYSDALGLPGSGTDQLWKDFDPTTGNLDRELQDGFGGALAAGDFDGNGCADLAIGIPGEDVGAAADAGMVLVLYGFPISGLASASSPGAWRWRLGADGIGGTATAGDQLGAALAAGDFDNDGKDDLAIGIPLAEQDGAIDAGRVLVMYGTASGLGATDHRIFSQNSSGADGTMLDVSQLNDRFGQALAVGDFNGDLADDLAIGVPGETLVSPFNQAGAVQILYGFTNVGLRLTGNQFWHESNVDTGGVEETGDLFGAALAAGDVTGEGVDDLVIGAPFEDTDGFEDSGAVTLLWGQFGSGLGTVGSTLYDQSDIADGESPGVFENFGYSLAIGDFIEAHARGAKDLAIGTVQESVAIPGGGGTWIGAGAVAVVAGGFGLEPTNAVLWAQGYRGSAGAAHLNVGQSYGHSLATGDFDGNGHADLAIGAISVNGRLGPTTTGVDSGAVYILFGALFADGFETGDRSIWSASQP